MRHFVYWHTWLGRALHATQRNAVLLPTQLLLLCAPSRCCAGSNIRKAVCWIDPRACVVWLRKQRLSYDTSRNSQADHLPEQ